MKSPADYVKAIANTTITQGKELRDDMISTGTRRSSISDGHDEGPTAFIEQLAGRRVATFRSYAHCFRDVSIRFQDGVLTLAGCVPTFYLKQILQTLLKNIDGVSRIDNQVEVVDIRSVSSVYAK